MKYIKNILFMLMVAAGIFTSCNTSRPLADINTANLYRDTTVTDTSNLSNLPWKEIFTDVALQNLIQEGLNNNLDLQIASARLKQAEANFLQSKMGLLPSLNANGDVSLNKKGDNAFNHTYSVSLSSSWELDIWGKLSSAKRASKMLLLKSDAYKRAVQTQLVANIATYYYTLLAYDAKLNITLKTIENAKQDVETMKQLKESNVVNGAAVMQSQASLYSSEVTIPDLKRSIRETENNLCALLGRPSGSVSRTQIESQNITSDLKTGIPAQLLANRPDVQEAEYVVRYAYEMTNVARAYFYPTLSITAEGGLSNNNLSKLFDPTSVFANIIGGIAQPLFNKGLNKQRLAVAKANQEEYVATFKQTLLNAGQEVSNALYEYQTATDKISLRTQQIKYLEKSVEFTKELLQYSSATNYTDVLTSEQSLLSAQLNSVNDKQQQLQAVVKLYRSLGGGWK